jgi:hypothetical protein
VLGLLFFFTAAHDFSGTGFVKVNAHPFSYLTSAEQYLLPLPGYLVSLGLPSLAAGFAGFAVIALFQAGFLAPAVPAGMAGFGRPEGVVVTLLVGAGLAGICAFFFTEAPGYSHLSFLHFSQLCFALLGARGLQTLLGSGRPWAQNNRVHQAILAAVAVLAALHVWQLSGAGVSWLTAALPRSAASLVGGAVPGSGRVSTCWQDEDSDLFRRARVGENPAVIFIPSTFDGNFACVTFWLTASHPVVTVHNYALSHLPGRASGSELADLLARRVETMSNALDQARNGKLSVAAVSAMRDTLQGHHPVYVFADGGLFPDDPARVSLVGRNERFSLWRLTE